MICRVGVFLAFLHYLIAQCLAETPEGHFLFLDTADVTELRTVDELRGLLNPQNTTTEVMMVMMYSFWCPHCKVAAPKWKTLAAAWRCTPAIRFYAFECSDAASISRYGSDGMTPPQACETEGVEYYPHLTAYWQRDSNMSVLGIGGDGESGASSSLRRQRTQKAALYNSKILKRRRIRPTLSTADMITWIESETPVKNRTECNAALTWDTAKDLPVFHRLRETARWDTALSSTAMACPDRRLHNALYSFGFLLRNWVPSTFRRDALLALHNLLVVTGKLLPGIALQKNLLELDDYVSLCLNNPLHWNGETYQQRLDQLDLNGLKILPSGVPPTYLDVQNVSSGIWELFHILTIALLQQYDPYHAVVHLQEANVSCPINAPPVTSDMLSKKSPAVEPRDITYVLYSTITTFFNCDDCRRNFANGYQSCRGGRCEWVPDNGTIDLTGNHEQVSNAYAGVVLWLWRFHNIVTFRTAAEATASSIVSLMEEITRHNETMFLESRLTSYEGQDVRFPPRLACPECRKFVLPESTDGDAFRLAPTLVREAVFYELEQRAEKGSTKAHRIPLEAFDKIEDFRFLDVLRFLQQYYWRLEWMNPNIDIVWNADHTAFLFRESVPETRRLPLSVSEDASLGDTKVLNAIVGFMIIICIFIALIAVKSKLKRPSCIRFKVSIVVDTIKHFPHVDQTHFNDIAQVKVAPA